MTDEELKQLVESNARAIQALTDTVNTFADTVSEAMQEAQAEREELREATIGIANLLASLDQDRPTILRKLTAIENKVDRILERGQGEHSVGSE